MWTVLNVHYVYSKLLLLVAYMWKLMVNKYCIIM